MDIYTAEQIKSKIIQLDKDIETAQGISEYKLNTGQGEQDAKRQSLTQLISLRNYWMTQLEKMEGISCGLMSGEFQR
jgi:hypothetical protein